MSIALKYQPPNAIAPFVLGQSIDCLPFGFMLRKRAKTEMDSEIGSQPYSVYLKEVEFALLDVFDGKIIAITALDNLFIDGISVLGGDLSMIESLIGEKCDDETRVVYEDGSVESFFAYPKNRLIISVENGGVSSVCLFADEGDYLDLSD